MRRARSPEDLSPQEGGSRRRARRDEYWGRDTSAPTSPVLTSDKLRLNPSGPEIFPNEQFPQEDAAIQMFLRNGSVPNENLNNLVFNPYLNLESFSTQNYIPDLPGIITSREDLSKKIRSGERYMIKTPQDFEEAKDRITFPEFNWNNVVVAGGYALRMIGNSANQFLIHGQSDIDFFLYGLTPEQGLLKLREMVEYFKRLYTEDEEGPYGEDRIIIRTDRSLTFIIPGLPAIQIILRLYSHPVEVLLGFDLPCVRVMYDGQNVWMTGSARNSIVNRYNLLTGYQPFRTGTYESRALKYVRRGYDIRVINFQPARIDPTILQGPPSKIFELEGLARLLFSLKYTQKQDTKSYASVQDYDPLRHIVGDVVDFLNDSDFPNTKRYSDTFFTIYMKKPFFNIAFTTDQWETVFQNWNPRTTFVSPEYNGPPLPPSEVGPLRFIGSLSEYLHSLTKAPAWECQAYGLPSQC